MSEALPLPEPEPERPDPEAPAAEPAGDSAPNRPSWLVGAGHVAEPLLERNAPPVQLTRPDAGQAPPTTRFRGNQVEATTRHSEVGDESLAAAWKGAGSSVPKLTVEVTSPRAVEPDADLEDADEKWDDDEGPESEPTASPDPALPPVALAPSEPWWVVALDHLATNRLLQAGLAVAALAVGAWMFWPRADNRTTSLSAIKRHHEQFEGQPVRVRGEIGEVFDVGSGFVFLLHQGRDTVVVFSPSRRPSVHERVTIEGTISTGYLDGVPRVALFEKPATQ